MTDTNNTPPQIEMKQGLFDAFFKAYEILKETVDKAQKQQKIDGTLPSDGVHYDAREVTEFLSQSYTAEQCLNKILNKKLGASERLDAFDKLEGGFRNGNLRK